MATDWTNIAAILTPDCPSAYYRTHAIRLLSRVEHLGPLGQPDEEFKRAYRFLHYNNATYLGQVVRELLERASGPNPRLHIQHNAWRYVVAAHDEWIVQARIFYLVAGLLEGTLRSRLNQRMTDYFGSDWPSRAELVPSIARGDAGAKASRYDKLVALVASDATDAEIAAAVRELKGTSFDPVGSGETFVAGLPLLALQAFFTTKRLYNGTAQLKELLIDPASAQPVSRPQIEADFTKYRTARNAVAHYHVGSDLSFAQALFTAARVAGWLGVDLQHFYSAVDTRRSTELSRLLGPQINRLARGLPLDRCDSDNCVARGPWDWMMSPPTPTDGGALDTTQVERACLFHRVWTQATRHRHERLA